MNYNKLIEEFLKDKFDFSENNSEQDIIDWAEKNNCVIEYNPYENKGAQELPLLGKRINGNSSESWVYKKDDSVYKVFRTWQNFANKILIHNRHFPETQYAIAGVLKVVTSDTYLPIVKQLFIEEDETSAILKTPMANTYIKDMMFKKGFAPSGQSEVYKKNGDFIGDVHSRNVIVRKGVPYVIDDFAGKSRKEIEKYHNIIRKNTNLQI